VQSGLSGTTDPDLAAEREHLDIARVCLAEMTVAASRIADYGVDELASQSLGRMRAERLAALAADPDAPPFFGRVDRERDGGVSIAGPPGPEERSDPEPSNGHRESEIFHIGRRHVRDSAGDPVVVDWRAPISRAFYRATPQQRMGVRLRRRFGFQHGELTSFEDEHLDRGELLGLASDLLRHEIERPRVGPMRDIVATIQPDQDDLVRADLDTSLCIQGSPGTGKTAVGLHRAAYLLYTYPQRLRRSGVLVVGPNRAFLHYIAQVLPSLGEGGIEQATIDELMRVRATATETATVATLKGDARMADVLRRALLSHIAKPAHDLLAVVGTRRYRVPAHHLRRYVDDARRELGEGLRWSIARERIRVQIAEDVRRQREDAGGAPTDAEVARIARARAVTELLDEVWPAVDPAALLRRLWREPEFLARCGGAVLSDAELAQLADGTATTRRGNRWTPADIVLIDELDGLVTGMATFVHVVVDEAQDLSPMQCRAVARRCPAGSMTILGDLAQATTPWAPGAWPPTLAGLGQPQAVLRELTVGYRVPGEVLELSNRLLPSVAADVPPARSIRQGEQAVRFTDAAGAIEELRRLLSHDGSVGVLAADAQVPHWLGLIRAAGIDADPVDERTDSDTGAASEPATALASRVSVVGASAAKGLEFDSVLLVEPADIVAAEATRTAGLRRLYVLLTRAVSRLVIAHDQPIVPELGDPGGVPAPATAG
jgi:DNA helicase IV